MNDVVRVHDLQSAFLAARFISRNYGQRGKEDGPEISDIFRISARKSFSSGDFRLVRISRNFSGEEDVPRARMYAEQIRK